MKIKSNIITGLNILVLGIVLGISYVQKPLYTSNQNTKFLQGMAQAGKGYLHLDWLANTLDPLPVFTALVQFTQTYLFPEAFYLYYLILFGVYAYSLIGIAEIVFNLKYNLQKLIYFLLLVTIHCLEINIFDFETHIHLHYGVAQQYILGPYFQTSNFGVFLIFSIYLFLRKKDYWSILALAFAAIVHPTYLPSAAILTLCYQIIRYQQGRKLAHIAAIGTLSLLLVLPVVLYMTFTFQDTSPEIAEKARFLLINRIPHHSLPSKWLNSVAWVQILVVVLAIYRVRRTDLFLILMIPFGLATVLTLMQIITDSKTLAFMTPWRVSAILVPLSTSLILASLIDTIFLNYNAFFKRYRAIITGFCLLSLAIFCTVGTIEQIKALKRERSYFPLTEFIQQQKTEQDLYLVPHMSGNFVDFRLRTGAPIFINYKSHPYKDTEILEWHDRLMMAHQFYAPEFQETRCQMLDKIVKTYGVNHVIMENGETMTCPSGEMIYADERYRVYRLKTESDA